MYFTLTGHPGTWHYFTKKLWAHYWNLFQSPFTLILFLMIPSGHILPMTWQLSCHAMCKMLSWFVVTFQLRVNYLFLQDFSYRLINHWCNGCQGSGWIMTLTCIISILRGPDTWPFLCVEKHLPKMLLHTYKWSCVKASQWSPYIPVCVCTTEGPIEPCSAWLLRLHIHTNYRNRD